MDALGMPARWLGSAWRELASWLAPTPCVGCAQPPYAFCDSCRASLSLTPRVVAQLPNGAPVWAAGDYAGILATLIRELKTHGSRAAANTLAPAIQQLAASDVLAAQADRVVVPPSRASAFRTRGFHPIKLVADAAGLVVDRPFIINSGVRDQRNLSVAERQHNLDHAISVRDTWAKRLRGARLVLLDDVTTTGATLRELTRASEDSGATVVSAWMLAHTPRRNFEATVVPAD